MVEEGGRGSRALFRLGGGGVRIRLLAHGPPGDGYLARVKHTLGGAREVASNSCARFAVHRARVIRDSVGAASASRQLPKPGYHSDEVVGALVYEHRSLVTAELAFYFYDPLTTGVQPWQPFPV